MQNPVSYENLFTQYMDSSAILKTEDLAKWSLPTIFADPTLREGKQVQIARDYQSIGAMLTNYLASKLTQLLFPSNQPFFRLEGTQDNTAASLGMTSKDLSSRLAELENAAYKRIFMGSSYHQIVHALKLLIVSGNCLLYRDSTDYRTLAYSIRQYSILRDGTGKVLDIILKERITVGSVPASMQPLFPNRKDTDALTLWTRCKRQHRSMGDTFIVSQQIENHAVPDISEYPEKVCPFIPVVWNLVTGENYGRGLVEDFAGDFAKLSSLSEALALYEIETCRVIHLVSPGSTVDIDQLRGADSGSYVQGKVGEVAAVEAGDAQKIQALLNDLQTIYQRLAPAFMYSGNMRDAERVTAEEIKSTSMQADISLGGIYSSIADAMHVPLAHILVNEIEPSFITEVVSGGINLSVLTGVAALGRSTNIQNILEAANDIAMCAQVFPNVSKRFDMDKVIEIILLGRGVKLDDVLKSEEQLQQELKQQQMFQMQLQQTSALTSAPTQLQGQGVV